MKRRGSVQEAFLASCLFAPIYAVVLAVIVNAVGRYVGMPTNEIVITGVGVFLLAWASLFATFWDDLHQQEKTRRAFRDTSES